ncbi:hypothetical protein [Raoultella sp. HC6]|uniref:host cell division inhibitory peptide Kil n=1 Tax=Raoultella sp. HC6 TaxID=2923366 RepID=UPI001F504A1C|nr:hypothetical protein [Raoultella sp. HC6]
MASLPLNPQVMAARSKLAIAQFIGSQDMWGQAMASMKSIYEAERHAEDRMFCGRVDAMSGLNVRDVVLNHETYGDLVSVDGDFLTAHYKINTEVSY